MGIPDIEYQEPTPEQLQEARKLHLGSIQTRMRYLKNECAVAGFQFTGSATDDLSNELVDSGSCVVDGAAAIQAAAESLLSLAAQLGYHVTIHRKPLLPLAGGHNTPVVEVWAKMDRTNEE